TQVRSVEAIAVKTAEGYRLGDPLDPATTMGPLVSSEQRSKVRGLIRRGIDEGAKLVTGGDNPPVGQDKGFFVRQTVFSLAGPDNVVAREEIFGPVLTIQPYETEDHAVRLATRS